MAKIYYESVIARLSTVHALTHFNPCVLYNSRSPNQETDLWR